MAKREDIPREPRPDERVGQKGSVEPYPRHVDNWGNPCGHEIDSPSPTDTDPGVSFKVPDCSYKSYDTFTWPEGKACKYDLPSETEARQTDETEDIKPKY